MMECVLDTFALMVYLEKERDYQVVRDLFVRADNLGRPLLMTTVNLGELYYVSLRECGEKKTAEVMSLVETLPIEIVNVDWAIAQEAGRFKAVHQMSYADCFAAALAKLRKAGLVTGDREFLSVEKEIRITWLVK